MLKTLKQVAGPRRLSEIVNMCTVDDGYMVDLNPPYQRGSVWSADQQRKLFESLLLGIRVGDLTINFRPVPSNPSQLDYSQRPRCVDGQQRIRALIAFFNDELTIPTDWVDDRGVDKHPMVPAEHTSNEIRFSELTRRGQMEVEGKTIVVSETRAETEADEARIFDLINWGGVAMTDADRQRAAQVAGDTAQPSDDNDSRLLDGLDALLEDMRLHDNTGDPQDEGYMAAHAEVARWAAERRNAQ